MSSVRRFQKPLERLLIVKPGCFRVRVPGHSLRHFDAPAVCQVVRNSVAIPASVAGERVEGKPGQPELTL